MLALQVITYRNNNKEQKEIGERYAEIRRLSKKKSSDINPSKAKYKIHENVGKYVLEKKRK